MNSNFVSKDLVLSVRELDVEINKVLEVVFCKSASQFYSSFASSDGVSLQQNFLCRF